MSKTHPVLSRLVNIGPGNGSPNATNTVLGVVDVVVVSPKALSLHN